MKNEKLHKWLVAVAALTILLSGIKWSIGLQYHMDVMFGDEAEYIRKGLWLFHKVYNDWGPFYNLWYKFLSLFQHDNISLYFLNYKIGSIGVGLLLFFFLIRYNIHLLVAFSISYCYLFSEMNMNTWPRVTHFVVMVILLTLILISYIKDKIKKLIVFAIAVYLCGFARPELMLVFVILCGILAILLIKNFRSIRKYIPLLASLAVLVILTQIFIGMPAKDYMGMDRTYYAFRQHYTINYQHRTHAKINAVIEWMDFTEDKFGDCTNLMCVIRNHFDLLVPHVLFNIKIYLMTIMKIMTGMLIPDFLIKSMKLRLLAFGAFIFCILLVLSIKKSRMLFGKFFRQNWYIFGLIFLFGSPSMGTCTIIYPRDHYITMQIVLFGFIVASFLDAFVRAFLPEKINLAVIPFALFFFIVAPRANGFVYQQIIGDLKNLCCQKMIRYVDSKNWKEQHVIFSNIFNINMLFKTDNFDQFNTEYMFKHLPRSTRFTDVMQDKKIDIVVVNSFIEDEGRLVHDSTWHDFITYPAKYGFHKEVYNNICDNYLLVKDGVK